MRYTAVIADDHVIVRDGLKALVEGIPDLTTVAEAENGLQAITAAKTHRPDIMILDVAMPYASGVEVLEEVRRWSPDTKIVVFTGTSAAGQFQQLIQGGVQGIFLKQAQIEELLQGLPDILAGSSRFGTGVESILRKQSMLASLTPREQQVLQQIVTGSSNRVVAERLNISLKTVDNHRTNLMQKLEAHSATELIRLAIKEGLVDIDAV